MSTKTRRADGYTFHIEYFAHTKAEAKKIALKLKQKSFVRGARIWPTSSGYEIGWRY